MQSILNQELTLTATDCGGRKLEVMDGMCSVSLGVGRPGLLFNSGLMTWLVRRHGPRLADAYVRLRIACHEAGSSTGVRLSTLGREHHISRSTVSNLVSLGLLRLRTRNRIKTLHVVKHRDVSLQVSPLNRWIRLTPETWRGVLVAHVDYHAHAQLEEKLETQSVVKAFDTLPPRRLYYFTETMSLERCLSLLEGPKGSRSRFDYEDKPSKKERQILGRIRRVFGVSPGSIESYSPIFACNKQAKQNSSFTNSNRIRTKEDKQLRNESSPYLGNPLDRELYGKQKLDCGNTLFSLLKIKKDHAKRRQRLVYRNSTAKILGLSVRTISSWRSYSHPDTYAMSTLLAPAGKDASHTRLVPTPGAQGYMTPKETSYEVYCKPSIDEIGHPVSAIRHTIRKCAALKKLTLNEVVTLNATDTPAEELQRLLTASTGNGNKTLSKLISEDSHGLASDLYRQLRKTVPTTPFKTMNGCLRVVSDRKLTFGNVSPYQRDYNAFSIDTKQPTHEPQHFNQYHNTQPLESLIGSQTPKPNTEFLDVFEADLESSFNADLESRPNADTITQQPSFDTKTSKPSLSMLAFNYVDGK